jgi:hypothetical protein
MEERRRRGKNGVFTSDEAHTKADATADAIAESRSKLAKLGGPNSGESPEEALLPAAAAADASRGRIHGFLEQMPDAQTRARQKQLRRQVISKKFLQKYPLPNRFPNSV